MFTRSFRRRSVYLACMLVLGMTAFAPFQTGAQETEVIAVEDVTNESECVLTSEMYGDKAHTQLIESSTSLCPPGSVIQAKRMEQGEAQAQGLHYVISTGNAAADGAAVEELKWDLLTSIRGPKPEPTTTNDVTINASCGTPAYYGRTLSYNAAGGRVEVGVNYHDVEDSYPDGCDVIVIYSSYSYLSDPLDPGRDLYWDEEYYDGGITAQSWDMGCQDLTYNGGTNYTYMNWRGYPNYWFTDETIDDDYPRCQYWGTEYTGMVVLDT